MKNKRKKELWKQFREYELGTSMTGLERRALREWVKSGHSVYDRRHPAAPVSFKRAFPDVSRKTCGVRRVCDEDAGLLGDCTAHQYPGSDLDFNAAQEQRPCSGQAQNQNRKRNRELFHLWEFIGREGIWEEAKEYVEDMADTPTPFEDE